jgi:Tfp pilus assembly ATPase PilU
MQTMNQSLYYHYTKRNITYEDALGRSPVPEEMLTMIQRGGSQGDGMENKSRRPSKVKY